MKKKSNIPVTYLKQLREYDGTNTSNTEERKNMKSLRKADISDSIMVIKLQFHPLDHLNLPGSVEHTLVYYKKR